MKAAVVTDFAKPPAYAEFEDPVAGPGETLVDVSFAALSTLAKSQASGKHYSSRTTLPLVPGVDGVGRLRDGTRVYFAFARAPYGSMAAKVAVPEAYLAPLPADLDDAVAAGAANAGMSSFAALKERARFVSGETVLINGATGVSGRLAVQVARALGAKHVVATGRNERVLAQLGADDVVSLDGERADLTERFRRVFSERRVDVVLDYLWGAPASALLAAIPGNATEGEPRIRYVQIGSSAGLSIDVEAKLLRSSGLELLGSGLGSVALERLVAVTSEFFAAFVPGGFTFDIDVRPLADIATAWHDTSGSRIVFAI